jgi:hypothetical protein
MGAAQGERYRIIAPAEDRSVIGQGPPRDRYRAKIGDLVVEDIHGDVINASENVEYPRGTNKDYRHVRWIDEHPERFELIDEPKPKED